MIVSLQRPRAVEQSERLCRVYAREPPDDVWKCRSRWSGCRVQRVEVTDSTVAQTDGHERPVAGSVDWDDDAIA